MKFEIKHRFNGYVLFSLETENMRLCVEAAIKSGADLGVADLRGADLGVADLRDANLRDANLRDANLRDANLRDANLRDANLGCAYLGGANLGCADLRGAYLGGANLRDANLRGADLRGAYLRGAYLRGADLGCANLGCADLGGAYIRGAKIRDDITVTKVPLQIIGLEWLVTIWDQHMQIGCEFHSHEEWRGFTDDDWLRMGGKEALYLKREQFQMLIGLCDQHKPRAEPEAV